MTLSKVGIKVKMLIAGKFGFTADSPQHIY